MLNSAKRCHFRCGVMEAKLSTSRRPNKDNNATYIIQNARIRREANAVAQNASGFVNSRFGAMTTVGGIREAGVGGENSLSDVEHLARFAVQEHNTKQNALLEYGKVVKAKEQTVAGTLHHITIEAIDGAAKKLYEAKVWVKPWMNFKELQEFKAVEE